MRPRYVATDGSLGFISPSDYRGATEMDPNGAARLQSAYPKVEVRLDVTNCPTAGKAPSNLHSLEGDQRSSKLEIGGWRYSFLDPRSQIPDPRSQIPDPRSQIRRSTLVKTSNLVQTGTHQTLDPRHSCRRYSRSHNPRVRTCHCASRNAVLLPHSTRSLSRCR